METIISEIFKQYGSLSVLILLIFYNIWINIQAKKSKKNDDTINETFKNMSDKIDDYIENEHRHLESIDGKINAIEDKLNNQTQDIINNIDINEMKKKVEHNRNMINQLKIGPKIHKILSIYKEKIGLDHIFLATFHNGTESLSGIPYYKFDMIAEKFKSKNKKDVEFCHMYKDVDIMKHDRLPVILIQEGKAYFKIEEDGSSELQEVDDIIYRRMLGRNIKQLYLYVFKNKSGIISGFVGGVQYDYNYLYEDEFEGLIREIENIFNDIDESD